MKNKGGIKQVLKKVWNFIWNDDSIWSWIVNIILAFLIIKFLVYPGLGLILGTTHPVVAVVSSSMEHNGVGFGDWYDSKQSFYGKYNITKEDFSGYKFKNGFNKGDIMLLVGKDPERLKKGDTIVFFSQIKQPIIHRIIRAWQDDEGYHFQTKGDNNPDSISLYVKFNQVVPKNTNGAMEILDETDVYEDEIVGKAVVRVPWLGYIKIWFVGLLQLVGIVR